ncbi:MobV family relaxase, partial [Rhodocytophaga aerolata]
GKASLVGSKEMVKKWTAFEEHCHQWLKEQYGEKNIVNFTTHVDEQTPHIHAVIVPIDPKGKLNCRAYLGGREKLRGLQDSFAQAHQGIGLERGIKGSKANHTTVKAFYAHANEFTQAPSLDIALPPFQASIQLPQTNFAGIMKQHPGEYKESQEKLVKAQLEVQQKKVVEQAKDKMRELHQVAIAAEVLKKENDKLKGELKGLQQQIKESTQKQAQLSSKLTNQTTKTQSLIHYLLSGKISKAELGQAIEQVPAKEDKRQESIRALLTEMGIAVKQAQVEQKIDGKLTQQEKPKGPKHNLP